jgi:hypothetical protein
MTKAKVLACLQKCAKKLDRTPTYTEIWRMTKITKYMIKLHFGTLADALERAGIAARGVGHRLDTLTLLEDWAHLTRKVGRPPSFMEYRKAGNYGANSFLNRCGAWSRVGERFCALVKERKKENLWADVLKIVKEWEGKTTAEGRRKMARRVPSERVMHDETQPRRKVHPDRPIYGPPARLPGLRNAPTTENGVIFACEALREVAPGKWQRENIEFELFSRNFLEHQHDPKKCDIIVCWVHNWPECPEWIEVIELSKVVKQIG